MGATEPVSMRGENWDCLPASPAKYLTFNLHRMPFACAMDSVCEVMGVQPILPLAGAPAFVHGAILVREKAIPVIDLRVMLGFPARVPNRRNCILLVTLGRGLQAARVGLIVDSVSEVVEIRAHEIREIPEASESERIGLVAGTTRIRGRLTRLINVDVLLTSEERTMLMSPAA